MIWETTGLKADGVRLIRSIPKTRNVRGKGMRRLATVLSVFLPAAAFAPAALADGPEGHDPPADTGPGARGPSWEQLKDAGWDCFDPDGELTEFGQHCVPPRSPMHPDSNTAETAAASNVMVFDAETDGFAGTELLRFTGANLEELPCPKDGGWHFVDPFWACHHWRGAPEGVPPII